MPKKDTTLYPAFGQWKTLKEWAAYIGITREALKRRVLAFPGMSMEEMINMGKRPHGRRRKGRAPKIDDPDICLNCTHMTCETGYCEFFAKP